MYTSYIGKKFIKIYNEKEQTSLTAGEFFEQFFFPLFFEDDSHLLHVGNSPFFQKPKDEDVIKRGGKALAQLNNLQENIRNDEPNMAIYVGFAAKDLQGTTSGQLTSINFQIDEEEMYASWIGEALAIGVSGGFVMLIDDNQIITALFEGWQFYRDYLKQTPNVKDKQIETWNGQWLCHRLGKKYNLEDPSEGFQIDTTEVQGRVAIPTKEWSKVVFALAKKYPSRVITAYCYNLSQTNTTLGFINLYLPEVSEMYHLRDKLFLNEKNTILNDGQIQKLETFYNFRSACKLGTIGLKALEPDKLRTYMPRGTADYAQGKDFKFSNEQSYLDYQIYKLWILAMLNKTELLQLASNVAQALITYEKQDNQANRGKTTERQEAKEVKEAKNIREFIEGLTNILAKTSGNTDTFKIVVEQVLKMPSDNFPLFATLIRFEYQYQIQKGNN
ncbi:hypothetical protein QNI19_28615 [Cytophagaceae bacterium DM2B3-1]|uniref:Uncharacterized protein n=1 Tax=Xanthocytophaga flava TaxID=3048013 RepID=A0ABT7CT37_9BACT|nr:hypothetical protein [Xanthocytophaga flavus]MDJ1496933.1 hypothetical protein [Xanthocytophaga flavus]